MLKRLFKLIKKEPVPEPPLYRYEDVLNPDWAVWYAKRYKVSQESSELAQWALTREQDEPFMVEDEEKWIEWLIHKNCFVTREDALKKVAVMWKEHGRYSAVYEPPLMLSERSINPTWVSWFTSVKGCTRRRGNAEAVIRCIRNGLVPLNVIGVMM